MSTINSIGLFGMITTLLIGFICLITFNWDIIWIMSILFVIFAIMAGYESEEEIAEETKNKLKNMEHQVILLIVPLVKKSILIHNINYSDMKMNTTMFKFYQSVKSNLVHSPNTLFMKINHFLKV